MTKASTRFRTRKINFKSAISIYVGSYDNPFDEDFAAPSPGGLPGFGGSGSHPGVNGKGGKGENGETIRVETGVDKEEEGEHHLQAVISASAAALQRSGAPGDAAGGSSSKPMIAHIPTPDATGLVPNYTDYYQHDAYVDPHSYIRYSDTVEETSGVVYTMDEDDEDFLIDHNIRAQKLAKVNGVNGTSPINGSKTPVSQPGSPVPENAAVHDDILPSSDQPVIAIKGHYPPLHPISGIKAARASNKKAKEAIINASVPVLSEDDFELVMDLFERITDRKVPTLHLDISRIPALEDLEQAFPNYLPSSSLRVAKAISRIIYPHWKERRTRAGGKNIVPQLDYDETNETPYVCFRRREVKVARKTRRTDNQTMERLVRLKSDLTSAQELLFKVLERERCKREAILAEARIFESRVQMRDLKRRLGESAGDETILIARKEKKRRREDMQGQPGGTKIVITNRLNMSPLTPGLLPDPLPPYKDRTANATQRVDKDMQRKREQELGWEDITDTAFSPFPQPLSARLWRATERHILPVQDGRTPAHLVTFDHSNLPFIQRIDRRYRKRVGRGGRVHLDRLAARDIERKQLEPLDSDIMARLEERWRYDSDIGHDLPTAREPLIADDFDLKFASSRVSLATLADWDSLSPHTAHVEEALRWLAKEPEPLPPVQVVGKLPGQRIAPYVSNQNGQLPSLLPANMANQLYAAANRAMSVTQAQAQNVAAQQIRRASTGGPKSPVQQQQQQQQQQQMQQQQPLNPPQPFPIRRLMMENNA